MEKFLAILLIAFLAITVLYNTPAGSINGEKEVKTKPVLHFDWRDDEQTDATIKVIDTKTNTDIWGGHIVDNRVYESKGNDSRYKVVVTKDLHFGETLHEIGLWTGYANFGSSSARHWQTGAYYSPCRIFYRLIAPDIRASQDAIGLGVTLYPPSGYLPSWLKGFGIGVGYMGPFDGGDPSLVYSLSFSSHN